MAAFEWRSQTRLLDEVADALRERIYAGDYAPGAILRQEHIAAEFGISRTPLREALRVLERDGLVIHLPGRGVRVASADLTRLIDAYAVREVLDGVAARFAAERATDADIVRLRAHVAGQGAVVDPWDPKAYTQSNVDFHMAVMNTAGNASLIAFVPLLRMTSQVLRRPFRCRWIGRAMQSASMEPLSKPSLRAMARRPSGWRGRIFAQPRQGWRRECRFRENENEA